MNHVDFYLYFQNDDEDVTLQSDLQIVFEEINAVTLNLNITFVYLQESLIELL